MSESNSECKIVDLIHVDPVKMVTSGGVIIYYWHVGKPELPLAFPTLDAKELAVRILRCLAFQGDESAAAMLEHE